MCPLLTDEAIFSTGPERKISTKKEREKTASVTFSPRGLKILKETFFWLASISKNKDTDLSTLPEENSKLHSRSLFI